VGSQNNTGFPLPLFHAKTHCTPHTIMPPLVDIHVHLLAGMDDGPKTADDALSMCKMMVEQGIRYAAAGAHQNDDYPDNSPDRIRAAAAKLAEQLKANEVQLDVRPCAEVMVGIETLNQLGRGELMTVGDAGKYLLIEMPHGLCVELKWLVQELDDRNIRPILGHAERSPEVLHDSGRAEALIQAGCLLQVSSKSITDPPSRQDAIAIRNWFKRRMVHVLGSDGHSLRRRPPVMAAAYKQVVKWVGEAEAVRIASANGIAMLHGRPIHVPPPLPATKSWFSWFSGSN
jgi:protein-tyrosine phosphatase